MQNITERIDARGVCWEWTGARSRNGYGNVKIKGRNQVAHRAVWELLVGPIPAGLQLDHLCRNKGCVMPDHLEPVTPKENTRRGRLSAAVAQSNRTRWLVAA